MKNEKKRAKKHRIFIRVTREDRERYHKAAFLHHMTLSEMITRYCEKMARAAEKLEAAE